ncbi:WD40-repeat-containing domain protein [Syncephalastrum racemosum]|uniref:WD40-repeat-containing domain protein n=1 Tax=Syncephalastrum racemosum TaxID=13706 RepID=A0A1X2H5F5_SYNRA|nr:WD40-repeat-containing domain protein [Syncephalastrum racemosum]
MTVQGGSDQGQVFRHHAAPVLSLDFHPLLPHLLLTSSMDGTCAIVDTAKSVQDQNDGHDPDAYVVQRFRDHTKYVVRALFSSDGTYLATASYDATLCVYQVQIPEQDPDQGHQQVRYHRILHLGPFLGNVETICFAGPDILVAGVTNDNYLHYIHLPDGRDERVNMNANNDDWVSFSPQWISCSPDGRYLLCTTNHSSGRIILFSIRQSTQVQNYYYAPSDSQFTMRRHVWHPSGLYFYASGSEDNMIGIIETKTGQVAAKLDGHTAMVRTMTIDPTVGLVSGGYDQRVNIWSKDVSRPLDR